MSGELQSFHTISLWGDAPKCLNRQAMSGKRVHDECKLAVMNHYFPIEHSHKM